MPATARATRPRHYERRDPTRGVLHHIVQAHLETFLSLSEQHDPSGRGIPAFVERELRGFLDCGVLANGFARFRCDVCNTDRLVAFSCRGRGFCPSCGGRRMTAQAAHLVDEVIPHVPTRQYVLSFPFSLRRRLAFDHDLCRAVLRIVARALERFYRDRARGRGHPGGRTGAVTVIQRFGGALNLNPHFHTPITDGVFTETPDGNLRFHALSPPSDDEVAQLLATIVRRVTDLLVRRGIWTADGEPIDDEEDDPTTLAQLQAASIQQVALTGPRTGQPTERIGSQLPIPPELEARGPRRARLEGFDLHANAAVRADSRERLEQLIAYQLRPPVSDSRLELVGDRVRLRVKTPWRDGTTHLLLTPLELLERLAALVPRPHKNQLVYHGVFAGNAHWRSRAVAHGRPAPAAPEQANHQDACPHRQRTNPRWAELMRRGVALHAQ